jgi:hypothetical protein
MSQRHSEYPRRPNDDYATPPWVAQAIVPYLRQPARHLWDPASGAGQLVQALSAEGLQVVGTADDFLAKTDLPDDRIDCIVTNPPYGIGGRLACQFIAHAIELVPLVAMLLRADFDSAKTRTHLFRDCPVFSRKVMLLDRIRWFPGNVGPSTTHAWFIWDRRHCGSAAIGYAGKDNHHYYQHRSNADPLIGQAGRHDPSPSLERPAPVNRCYYSPVTITTGKEKLVYLKQLDLLDHIAQEKLRRALEAVSYDGTEIHHIVDRELRDFETENAAREIERQVRQKYSNTVSIDAAVELALHTLLRNSRVIAAPPGAQPGSTNNFQSKEDENANESDDV